MNLQQIRGRRIVSAHNRLIRRAMFDDAEGLQVSAASVRPFLLMSKESIQRRVELSHTAELQQYPPNAGEGVGHFGA